MIDATSEGMDTQNHDEERHPVRKLLKSLPKIHPGENFELQLRRKLAEQQPEQKSLWDIVFSPRRIPAYALSVLAIAAAGTVVYFSLIRTNMAPVEMPQKEEEVKHDSPQQQPPPTHPPPIAPSSRVSEGQKQPEGEGRETPTKRFSIEKKPSLPGSSRESEQDEMMKRGLFKEVGGTGMRSEQAAETSDMPFLRAFPNAALQRWDDSIAQADSAKRDSLMKLLKDMQHMKSR